MRFVLVRNGSRICSKGGADGNEFTAANAYTVAYVQQPEPYIRWHRPTEMRLACAQYALTSRTKTPRVLRRIRISSQMDHSRM